MRRFLFPLTAGLAALALVTSGAACAGSQAGKEQYFQRGKDFASQQKFLEATVEFRNAIQLDPNFGDAHWELAHAYLNLNDGAKAMVELVRAADLMPASLRANIEAVQILLFAGKFQDAQARANQALQKDPNSVIAQLSRGAAQAGLRDFEAATADVEAAIRIDPQDFRPYVTLGALQVGQGRTFEAETAFGRAVDLAPNSAVALTSLADLYFVTDRPREGEYLLQRAVQAEPSIATAHVALANYYLSVGRFREAEAPLKAAANIPSNGASKLALASYYVKAQRIPEAMALLKASAATPDGFASATTRLAVIDFEQQRRADAHRGVDEVLAREPRNTEALMAKARFLLAEQKLDEALVRANALVAADPRSASAHELLGAVHVARNDPPAALEAFNQAFIQDPARLNTQLQLARLRIQTGAAREALGLAQRVIRLAPNDLTARSVLAMAQAANGDVAGTQATLDGLVRDFPNVAAAHEQLGAFLMVRRDMVGAGRAFDRSLELDPLSLEGLQGRIAVDLAQNNAAAARTAVEDRLRKFPKETETLLLAAATYRALGDLPRQETLLGQIIEIDPDNIPALSGLAGMHLRQRDLDRAKAEYEALAKRWPQSAGPATMVGVILEAQGRSAEARKVYEDIVARVPDAALAANNLAWQYAEREEQLDTALQLAQRARRKYPRLPQFIDTFGWVLLKKELGGLAVRAFDDSVKADPNNPVYHYHLGLAYQQARNPAMARQAFTEALALRPDYGEAREALKSLETIAKPKGKA